MYNLINILPDLLPLAEKFVFENDRELYVPFLTTVERFAIDNGVILGGRIGLDLLLGKPLTKDSFVWDLYADDTFQTAKKLTIALYETKVQFIDARTVSLRTDLRHREFTIFINTRPMIKIYSLDKYRGIKLADLMGPVPRTSYFLKENIFCIPEEMQLIEIYRGLYSPARVSEWKDYLAAEHALTSLIEGHLGEKALKTVVGGRSSPRRQTEQIILKFVANIKALLIGDYAMQYYDQSTPPAPRIQFITDMDIDEVTRALDKIVKNKVSGLAKHSVTNVQYSLNIPTDFQITKHTLYLSTGKEQTPLADVYNCTTFELVPYNLAKFDEKLNIRVGNPWVILRFRYIDLWILKLISNLSEDAQFLRTKIEALLDSIAEFRKATLETLAKSPDLLFKLEDYAGVYINELEAKKRLIKETGEKFAIFYPAKNNSEST